MWEDGTRASLSIMSRVSLVLSKGDRDFEFIAVVEKPDYSDPGLREEITID